MASIKNRIVDYVVSSSCLDFATGKPASLTIRRGGLIASTTVRHPEVLVYVGPEAAGSVGLRRNGNPMNRAFSLICEIRVNAAVGTALDETLDPIEVWVEKRLFLDDTFGGLAAGITGWRVEQDARQSDQGYAVAACVAEVQFVTVRGNPESQG
jgi:hypothetical protein